MLSLKPIIGNWYLNRAGTAFEVVAIDDTAHTIELQFYDGTVDEIDKDRWAAEVLEEIEPPEDYSGSLDIPADDPTMSTEFVPRKDWPDPLDYIDTDYVEPE